MTLEDFFIKYPAVALAFSGGVDSAYLLYMAKKYAKKTTAYYVKTEFQPEFELEDAKRLARELNVDMRIINLSVLDAAEIVENPPQRCYYCKKRIFGAIIEEAVQDGYTVLLDGTNASDDEEDRPGMRALKELDVLSSLRICGLKKDEIRKLSEEAGLFTWNKPAYACLATRIQSGEEITKEKLKAAEEAEKFLFSLGFSDFRVRSADGNARLQLNERQLPLLIEKRADILAVLKKYYKTVSLDLEVR
ncbi:MAG TPA: ATP-dependent sacrificial sulfur transferase LarE [Candidatus Alectryocaccobium stercorigallinarum]|nr:ATP-dependent sacrificial sulfur transferase LarE [Candidatus Alectryocaccobium stercorigallinarum]